MKQEIKPKVPFEQPLSKSQVALPIELTSKDEAPVPKPLVSKPSFQEQKKEET